MKIHTHTHTGAGAAFDACICDEGHVLFGKADCSGGVGHIGGLGHRTFFRRLRGVQVTSCWFLLGSSGLLPENSL